MTEDIFPPELLGLFNPDNVVPAALYLVSRGRADQRDRRRRRAGSSRPPTSPSRPATPFRRAAARSRRSRRIGTGSPTARCEIVPQSGAEQAMLILKMLPAAAELKSRRAGLRPDASETTYCIATLTHLCYTPPVQGGKSMYSDSDLEAAVAAGALSPEAADGASQLRGRAGAATPAVDEEHFRLLTGFNDIFVSHRRGDPAVRGRLDRQCDRPADRRRRAFALRRPARRRAPPGASPNSSPASGAWRCPASCFCSPSSAACCSTAFVTPRPGRRRGERSRTMSSAIALVVAASAAVAAGATWLHWRRFRVPITIAAGARRRGRRGHGPDRLRGRRRSRSSRISCSASALVLGLGVFLFAMWWDSSDRAARPAARTSPSGCICWRRR